MAKFTQVQRIMAAREASRLERAHTIRHNDSYTNGQHSFDMLTITLELRDETSAELMKAIIYHDLPERWIGDMPFPAKEFSIGIRRRLQDMERNIGREMGWITSLTPEEGVWLYAVDRLEFLLWADDQAAMGNRHLDDVAHRCYAWFEDNKDEVPIRIREFLKDYSWQRTPDNPPL